jgi:hypothetical protein
VRILFDQGTPAPLRRFLERHEVATAYERGWPCLTNGELLDIAEQQGSEAPVPERRPQDAVEHWQVKSDGTRRGIVEVIAG